MSVLLVASGSVFSLAAQEFSSSVFFNKKEGPGQAKSEVIFLDENGLGIVVTEATVDFRSGRYQTEPVKLVAHDPVSRLTLVRVPMAEGLRTKPVELGSSLSLLPGDVLYLGVEGDTSLSRFVSRESEYNEKPLPLELFRAHHRDDLNPALGHPLFDSAGRLVAINYRKVVEFGNGSFAYPVEVVKRIQGATVIDGVVQRSWFGVELLASDPFAVVQAVRQASPAAKAGIVKGDILLQIGERPIRSYSDALNAFFYLKEGEDEVVKFLRGTEVSEVTVTPELVPAAPPAPPVVEGPKQEVGV
ncbi:MAG: S1C family serine protease [Roseibacillus sp.]